MTALVEITGLHKAFGPTQALADVSLHIERGKVMGLIGENGAGKSTLIKVLAGLYRPDRGAVRVDGQPVTLDSPVAASRAGLAVVHQEPQCVPGLSALHNLFLGRADFATAAGLVGDQRLRERVRPIFSAYGYDLPLDALGRELTPSQRTLLALTRCLLEPPRLLILDEPTASFSHEEVQLLRQALTQLTGVGSAALFVSHRLEEVLDLCADVTAMRNGRVVASRSVAGCDQPGLIQLMSGAPANASADPGASHGACAVGSVLLRFDGLCTRDGPVRVRDASLELRQGEVVGLYGLAASGRTELLEAIYGLRRLSAGQVQAGQHSLRHDPRAAIAAGLRLVPEDRRRQALIPSHSVRDNLALGRLRSFARLGLTVGPGEARAARATIDAYAIKTRDPLQPVAELSGGNQQKLVFARAIASLASSASQRSGVLLCDEPTQAVDVGNRRAIHALMRRHADEGGATLFATSDIEELLALADRIVVLCQGRIAGVFPGAGQTSKDKILHACFPHRETADH